MEVVFKDLESLKKAVADCGLEFRQGQTTYRWYGKWMNDYGGADAAYKLGIKPEDYGKCEHAIGVPKSTTAYEVGVVKNPSGPGYVLVADFWQGGMGLEALAGQNCMKIAQAYGVQVNKKTLTGMGFQVTKKVLADGTIKLHCTR
jgi:hypothetical protein